MKLIIGLGNPGKKYANTRHNIGWQALDVLAADAEWKTSKKFQSLLAEINIAGAKALLAKPQTGMNKSGQAVRALASFYKIPLENILVIHDDIDLLASSTRLRAEGSSGGHNGLASIIESLGTEQVSRLKIGIAEKQAGKQAVPSEIYVLQPPGAIAAVKIKKSLATLPEILALWLS